MKLSRYQRTINIIGGTLDTLTLGFLAFLMFQFLVAWNIPMFLLSTAACGIWCISCNVNDMKRAQDDILDIAKRQQR